MNRRRPGPDRDLERAVGPVDGFVEHGSDEEIDEAVEGSFPASDPPPFWPGPAGRGS